LRRSSGRLNKEKRREREGRERSVILSSLIFNFFSTKKKKEKGEGKGEKAPRSRRLSNDFLFSYKFLKLIVVGGKGRGGSRSHGISITIRSAPAPAPSKKKKKKRSRDLPRGRPASNHLATDQPPPPPAGIRKKKGGKRREVTPSPCPSAEPLSSTVAVFGAAEKKKGEEGRKATGVVPCGRSGSPRPGAPEKKRGNGEAPRASLPRLRGRSRKKKKRRGPRAPTRQPAK